MKEDRAGGAQPTPDGDSPSSAPFYRAPQGQQFVKAEANLLRLPLFALSTKGLRALDGIECRGTVTRNGATQEYRFRATRNTATLYPGPLARAAHLALLSFATQHGLPVANPVTWSWRELCRRMGIPASGRTVIQLQQAIMSTAGLLLWSEFALYSKPDRSPIKNRKDALHLYDAVTFSGQVLPDGSIAEENFVWLSDWYMQNLNTLFTAPLNYGLWRQLDGRSTIASRLYEFLLIVFHRHIPALRVNYPTLAQMLPIRPERYMSSAQKQLAEPLRLLVEHRVLEEVSWTRSRDNLPQLQFRRGDHLRMPGGQATSVFAEAEGEFAAPVQVIELRNLRSAENSFVMEFYRQWAGEIAHRASSKELEQARQIVLEYGTTKAKTLLPLVVNRLRSRWPTAKTLTAALRYLPEVAREQDEEQRQIEQRDQARERRKEELRAADERQQADRLFRETWKPLWDALPMTEREAIRQTVLTEPGLVKLAAKWPNALEFHYLRELARRRNSAGFEAAETAPDA